MNIIRIAAPLFCAVLVTGCLEVEQHPPWINGEYNGKIDNLPQTANFHNDRLAWNARITNRNHQQNEYTRTGVINQESEAPHGNGKGN